MSNADGHFEARVAAKRETSAGIFITLSIHPSDRQALAPLGVGDTLMIGFAQVLNTKVEPIEVKGPLTRTKKATPARYDQADDALSLAEANRAQPAKRKFSELSLPAQCALRCDDGRFQRFLFERRYARDDEGAAETVRRYLSIKSRAELSTNHDAANLWRLLESAFQQWLTDETYKDQAR